jgi:curved DNA-binding protein CbpA
MLMGNESSKTEIAREKHYKTPKRHANDSFAHETNYAFKNDLNNYQDIFKKYSPYSILNASENDSMEEIIQKYRCLVKKHHPDKGGDPKKLHLIKEAFAEVNLIHENMQFSHQQAKKNFEMFNKNTQKQYPDEHEFSPTNEKKNLVKEYDIQYPYLNGSDPDVYRHNNVPYHSTTHHKIETFDLPKDNIPTQNTQLYGDSDSLTLSARMFPPSLSTSTNFSKKSVESNFFPSEANISSDQNHREFAEKFNNEFNRIYMPNENHNHGYGNFNWEEYEQKNVNKKFEIIPYESINYSCSSNNLNYETLDNNYVSDFSKYPAMNDKNLHYTDFLQAYTNNSCLLPDNHEKIWNEHFVQYHDRDLKKIKNQRENKPDLSESELHNYQKRIDIEQEHENNRLNNWRNWKEQQINHYSQNQITKLLG